VEKNSMSITDQFAVETRHPHLDIVIFTKGI
jgi:hypothetical protein